jgi:acetyltransferase-like isoleucine patch superfamily enzyme
VNDASKGLEVSGDGTVTVGRRTTISPDVKFVFLRPATVTFGDYCYIGPGVKFVCDGGDVHLGDWTSLHDRTLVLSTKGVNVGQHGWFGQHCVIDGTGGLEIGNGVRVGMYSQIWSHVAAGEQIEGCSLYGNRPVVLEDDVWLVGSCIVASGVTLGRRLVALIASNITKSWPEYSVIAGSPASPKPGLHFYKPIADDERWSLLTLWVTDIADRLSLRLAVTPSRLTLVDQSGDSIVFARSIDEAAAAKGVSVGATICCLESKRYNKRLTDLEHRVLKSLASNRARFLFGGESYP